MTHLNFFDILGTPSLLGIAAGRDAAIPLLAHPALATAADVTLLDFGSIELVTASAARESVFKLAGHLAELGTLLVCVNANEATLDELSFAAAALKQPLVVADLSKTDELETPRVLGQLEAAQLKTLRVVARLGEVDAKTASQESDDKAAGVTGWNNRLSNMASLRLLKERKVGKTKLYSLTVKGLDSGN